MDKTTPRPRFARRVLLFCLCVAAGLATGFAGHHYTAGDAWFLAVPFCVAIGWFMVADPASCRH